MMLVLINHRELTTESKRTKLSIIRFSRDVSLIACRGSEPVAYLIALLEQHLIVFTQSDTEDNGCHVLETMNPLFPLTPLASDIEHTDHIVSPGPTCHEKMRFGPTYCMLNWPIVKRVSYIPVVLVRARSTSETLGM